MKGKRIYKIFIFIVLLAMCMCFMTSVSWGYETTTMQDGMDSGGSYDAILNPDNYNPEQALQSSGTDQSALAEKVKPIINTIAIIGIIAAVITLVVLGIKYMVGSVEEKAEYKKTMMSYIIGVIFLVAISAILEIINNFVLTLF